MAGTNISNASISNATMVFSTRVLYGVFATERSFLIGVRMLERLEHASMLARKAVDGRLPPELIDLITEQLHSFDKTTVHSKGKQGVTIESNRASLKSPGRGMAYEEAAKEKLTSLGVDVTPVNHSRPRASPSSRPNRQVHYVHLSATKRPTVSLRIPSAVAKFPTGVHYTTRRGTASTILESNDDAQKTTNEDRTYYWRSENLEKRSEVPLQMAKLVECENVEEAMKNWDAEAVAKFVQLLDLKIVPFDATDPLRPGLHLWQRVEDL